MWLELLFKNCRWIFGLESFSSRQNSKLDRTPFEITYIIISAYSHHPNLFLTKWIKVINLKKYLPQYTKRERKFDSNNNIYTTWRNLPSSLPQVSSTFLYAHVFLVWKTSIKFKYLQAIIYQARRVLKTEFNFKHTWLLKLNMLPSHLKISKWRPSSFRKTRLTKCQTVFLMYVFLFLGSTPNSSIRLRVKFLFRLHCEITVSLPVFQLDQINTLLISLSQT